LFSSEGSGKTAAFLLPIVASLLSQDMRKGEAAGVGWRHTFRAYPLVIILAPTRELAVQIYQEALKVRI
jgi:ATP-dependent RNA helicase DDX3X